MVALDFRSLLRDEREKRAKQKNKDPEDQASANEQPTISTLCSSLVQRQRIELENYSVGPQEGIKALHYIPDFIDAAQEQQILECIDASPASRWVNAGERRMQNWGGRPGEAVIREALPLFLQAVVDATVAAGVYDPEEAPNHVLINEYRSAAGIPPHDDGPLYSPKVVTISMGGPALLSINKRQQDGSKGELETEVLLQPRCLFALSGDCYSQCVHGIQSRAVDTVTETCCNMQQAGVELGQQIPRAPRRISIVLVHKQGARKVYSEESRSRILQNSD